MDAVEMAGRWLTAVAFVTIAVASASAYRSRRTSATLWLATITGALGLGTSLDVLSRYVPAPASSLIGVTAALLLLAYPLLLLESARRVVRIPGWTRGVGYSLAVAVAVAVTTPVADGLAGPSFAGLWLITHGAVAGGFRAVVVARAGSPLAERLRKGVVALLVIGLLPAVSYAGILLAPAAAGAVSAVARLAAIGALATVWVELVSPVWLRTAATRRQERQVRELEHALASADDPRPLVREVTAAAARLLSGEAAWLTQGRRVVDAVAIPASTASAISADLPVASTDIDRRTWTDGFGTHLAAPAGEGWLVVCLGGDAVMQSGYELRLLRRLATLAGLAVERSRTHQRHHESVERLRAAAALKDDFLATISHELRTPLTAVRGFAELLRGHGATLSPSDRVSLLDRIVHNAADLENLIGGLMDLTTLREGRSASRIGAYDLRDLCDRVVARHRSELDGHELSFDVESGEVVTDGSAVGAALAQLLSNAVKFSDPGSTIELRGRVVGREATLAVVDQGVGIPVEEQADVFEPFYRTGDVLTRSTRGAGVGLTIVRELAAQLGGRATVRSLPDEGATFTLTIARVHPDAAHRDLDPTTRRWAVRTVPADNSGPDAPTPTTAPEPRTRLTIT